MHSSITIVAFLCVALTACADSSRSASVSAREDVATSEKILSRPVELMASTDTLGDSVIHNPSPTATDKILLKPSRWPEDLRASGRRPTSLQLRVRWSSVGTWDDTTLLHPTHAEVMESSVIVQDIGRMSLMGLGREDGKVLWRSGGRGSGPGELLLGEISRATDSSVFYYDSGNRRITEWTSDGALHATRDVSMTGMLRGLCRLEDGRIYVSVMPRDKHRFVGLARLAPGTDSLVDHEPIPLGRPIHRTAMDAQLKVFPLGDGSCALGASNESFLAAFSDISAFEPLTMVEYVPPPVVIDTPLGKGRHITLADNTPYAVQAVTRLGSYIAVALGVRHRCGGASLISTIEIRGATRAAS